MSDNLTLVISSDDYEKIRNLFDTLELDFFKYVSSVGKVMDGEMPLVILKKSFIEVLKINRIDYKIGHTKNEL